MSKCSWAMNDETLNIMQAVCQIPRVFVNYECPKLCNSIDFAVKPLC